MNKTGNEAQINHDLLETEYVEDTSDDIECSLEEDVLQHSYVFKNGTEIVLRRKPCILRWVHFDVETESEKFYRELLMLFTHWRNEEKDLIKKKLVLLKKVTWQDVASSKRKEQNMNTIKNFFMTLNKHV